MTTKTQTGQSGSSALLEGLGTIEAETTSAVSRLENSQQMTAEDLLAKISEVEQAMQEAITSPADKKTRDDHLQILTATLEQLREQQEPERKDIADAVMGLDALLNRIGQDMEKLLERSPEEEAVITNAQVALQGAHAAMAQAQTKWTILNIRAKAVAKATAQIELAKEGVKNAEIRAKKMTRDRLMSASHEDLLQQFSMRVEKALKVTKDRHETTRKQLSVVSARKEAAFKIREQAANAVERFDNELNAIEVDLRAAEEEVATLTNGSPEFVAQQSTVSGLKAKAEATRGNRNAAFAILQSKTEFTSALETTEASIQKTFDTQATWIAKLTSDSEERKIMFAAWMEQMKAVSDLDILANTNQVADELDRRAVIFMASSAAAAERARMKMFQGHPEKMRQLERARELQAQATASVMRDEAAMVEDFRNRHGIDPFTGSFLHHEGAPAETAGATS